MAQRIHYTNDVAAAIRRLVTQYQPSGVVWVADDNTCRLMPDACPVVTIPAGEQHKTLDAVCRIWDGLHHNGATRHTLVVNLGGGMVTDVGGMAAATFKRGVRFVNVPTTVLGAVDAAVGGKTGFNRHGLKNEIGVFAPASDVIVSTRFFDTLPRHEFKAGWGEVLKHALLSGPDHLRQVLDWNLEATAIDHDALLPLLQQSVQVKVDIVARDPHEAGEREALNLGHTVGHAIESLAMNRGNAVAHGYAVAWGLVAELVLSHLQQGLDSAVVHRVARFVRDHYGTFPFTCDDYDVLLDAMHHDKKSVNGEVRCTLLAAVGDYRVHQSVTDDDMRAALDIYRDLMD